ncbi:MAG: ABC transporter substrate-binding protein [Candidatus Methanodesulfokora washburnensis]
MPSISEVNLRGPFWKKKPKMEVMYLRTAVSKLLIATILVLVIVFCIGAYYYYTSTSMAKNVSIKKTVVIYASLSEMTGADPSTEFSNSMMWMDFVYEPLMYYDPLNDTFIPALAEKYEHDPSGLIWTFYLRRNAVFHDGTPVTAEAVKFSIERTISLGQGPAFIWDPVEKIETPDRYTVVFYLKYQAPLDKIVTADCGAHIFSPNIVKYANASNSTDPKITNWFNSGKDAGSGPYKLVKWDPENEVVFEKFTEWWGWKDPNYPLKSDKAPDIFIIKIVKDSVTQERLVKSGDVHIAQYVPLEDVESLKKDPNLQVVMKPSFQQLYMFLNTRKPPLDNVLVRKAIAHAIPYDDIVTIARSGLAKVASGPIPYGMWGHFDNLTYNYDLSLAKKLLAEAGYPNGINRTLILTYTAGDIYEQRTADLIKSGLGKIGINIEVRPMSWEEQWALAQSGWDNPQAAQDLFIMYWWPTVITPYDQLFNMFHSESKAFDLCYYNNSEYEKIIDDAHYWEGINKTKSLELYYKAQKIAYDDVPVITLWNMIDVYVARANIRGLDKAINPAYATVVFPQVLSVEG